MRRVVPGSRVLYPAASTARPGRKASPEPSSHVTKPKPLSDLNHFTVAPTSGPIGTGVLGTKPPEDGPRVSLLRLGAKFSSSNERRRRSQLFRSLFIVSRWGRWERNSVAHRTPPCPEATRLYCVRDVIFFNGRPQARRFRSRCPSCGQGDCAAPSESTRQRAPGKPEGRRRPRAYPRRRRARP